MSKGEKRPVWFKLYLHQKPIIDSVPDEVVGQAIKAALHYFATREELPLDVLPMVVYSSFKPHIEESFADYERDVRNGHKGGRPQKPPVTHDKGGLPTPTQEEKEEDKETEEEKETVSKADKLPSKANKKLNNSNAEKCDSFDLFWAAYPKKVGKAEARKAFTKVIVSTDILVAAIEKQKKSKQWTKDGGQFIPNPSTWLNQGRWEDELDIGITPQTSGVKYNLDKEI